MQIIRRRTSGNQFSKIIAYCNAALIFLLGIYLFLLPFFFLITAFLDPGLRTGEIPQFAFYWHKQLSDKFEPWATERIRSGRAVELSQSDISGTEWPIFSAVYYLWATESLQTAWDNDPSLSKSSPAEYAHESIEAAANLITDPNHATWVKKYWGNSYLSNQDIFYRMLYISGMTSYQKLTGNDRFQSDLISQIDSLSLELDQSPYGLLDDYPGQCYPIDILPAIAAIQRADEVLGTDHSAFIERAIRAFQGSRLDPQTQLPAYIADSKNGDGIGPSRGVGISYMLIWIPELWPKTAQEWYSQYEKYYWQENSFVSGVREFSNLEDYSDWYFLDVDAGPVVGGYGTSASAFGIGAARANGQMDHAYPLSTEALLLSWPLPNGTLLTARLLSNLSDAPYLGETALLFIFTTTPVVNETSTASLKLPGVIYIGLLVYIQLWVATLFISWNKVRKWKTLHPTIKLPERQFMYWVILVLLGMILLLFNKMLIAILFLVTAVIFPFHSKESYFASETT